MLIARNIGHLASAVPPGPCTKKLGIKLEQPLSEQARPNIHRLVRYANDVHVTVADHVEDDMTALGITSVTRMYVVPFVALKS